MIIFKVYGLDGYRGYFFRMSDAIAAASKNIRDNIDFFEGNTYLSASRRPLPCRFGRQGMN
jgi:hypothetical protein